MNILAVGAAHDRPDLLLEQIENFNLCCSGNVFHVVHINLETREAFFEAAKWAGIDFERLNNVHLFSRVRTKWGGIFHAWLLGVAEAMFRGIDFSHVLFHSSADMLVRLGADRHIEQYDLGVGKSVLTNDKDFWFDQIRRNDRGFALVQSFGQPDFLRARVDSCFFKRQLFFEIIYPLSITYDYLREDSLPDYPLEDVDMVCAVEWYCANNPSLRRARNLVFTSNNDRQLCTKEEIDWVRSTTDIYGVKRFSAIKDDQVRVYVRELLGQEKG